MYGQSLMITAIGYEVAKYRLHHDRLFPAIEDLLDKLPDTSIENPPCSGSILCLREGKRHRVGCPGKTVPIAQYVRGLK